MFYKKLEPKKLSEIISATNTIMHGNKTDVTINGVNNINNAKPDELCFIANSKYLKSIYSTKAACCILSDADFDKLQADIETLPTLLVSKNPYYSYSLALKMFYKPISENKIHSSAMISDSAKIGANVAIGPNTYIGDKVEIGEGCTVAANVVIENSIIGKNVTINNGALIGQTGFGFATEKAMHHSILHIGAVIIKDNASIGAGCTIDRGSLDDTIIQENVRLGDSVHIGHNVKIGKGTIIVAQTGIGGSSSIGNYCQIGGQVGIVGHINIGNFVKIMAKSGVNKDVKDNETIGGIPAVDSRLWQKQVIKLKNMVKQK